MAYHPPNFANLGAVIRSPTRGFYSGSLQEYSTGGIDMLGIIARVSELAKFTITPIRFGKRPVYVVARPNPVVNLGPVGEPGAWFIGLVGIYPGFTNALDHSCSFVVVDPYTPDNEIVYCRQVLLKCYG